MQGKDLPNADSTSDFEPYRCVQFKLTKPPVT